MHKKFEGLLKDYHVKPDKDWGKAAYILIKTEATRDIQELQMMVGSSCSFEVDRYEWEQPKKDTQLMFTDRLAEECAVCGHPRGFHKLDDHLCLGDDGQCSCLDFVVKTEVVPAPDLEVAASYSDDAVCDFCGHTFNHHGDRGCTEVIKAEDETQADTFCPCFDFVPLDGEPRSICECGHHKTNHTKEFGCMVNIVTGEIDSDLGDENNCQLCQCIRVYLEDGTPDGLVGGHDGEPEEYPVPDDGNALAGPAIESKPRRSHKKKESAVPVEVA